MNLIGIITTNEKAAENNVHDDYAPIVAHRMY
jgi:hypothetical protein